MRFRRRVVAAAAQVVRLGWLELQCCLFAVAIFVGLAVSRVIPLPIARYDALLAYGLVVTLVFYLLRWETAREVAVIFAFHLIGLALELFKVRVGSWVYPEDAWAMVGGVPLYSGFMYAAVGSYICQAFRRFDLRVNRFPWLPAAALAVAAYANFFTHHYLPDLRWLIALGFVVVLWRSRVFFTVGRPPVRDAAQPVVRADRVLPVGGRERGDLVGRLAVPGPGGLLAAGARGQVGIVGSAGQPELRAGGRRQALGGHLLRRRRHDPGGHARRPLPATGSSSPREISDVVAEASPAESESVSGSW